MINIAVVVLYVVIYGKVCMNPGQFYSLNVITYSVMNIMGLISGCFLGDALRRIWLTFKNMRGLLPNEKIMLLHLFLFLIYMCTTLLRTLQISHFYHLKNKDIGDGLGWLEIAYILSIWSLFFDQLLLNYLFIKFSVPATQVI